MYVKDLLYYIYYAKINGKDFDMTPTWLLSEGLMNASYLVLQSHETLMLSSYCRTGLFMRILIMECSYMV